MKRLFLDSDIMLDVTLQRPLFYLPALNVLELCHQSNFEAITSSVAFINTNYFLKKFAPLTRMQSLKRLRSIVSIIEINEKIIDKALNSSFTDFEDAVQYFAAVNAKADVIITRNVKDYTLSTLPVLTAEEFLSTL